MIPLVSANEKSPELTRGSSKRIEISIAALTAKYHFMNCLYVKRLITVSINPQRDAGTFLAKSLTRKSLWAPLYLNG